MNSEAQLDIFEPWLRRWNLTPDGEPMATISSDLLPVRNDDMPAMLKIPRTEEERRGGTLMAWYAGAGAAKVLAYEDGTLLLERALSQESLVVMSRTGRDDVATRILCETVARLHAPRQDEPPSTLLPLPIWFRALESASRRSAVLATAGAVSRELLSAPEDVVALHGDIHHGNVLHDTRRGWLAIDPKALLGERGFDYANIFCNPDGETAAAPGCLPRRIDVVASDAQLDRRRLLKWVVAYAGLSAAWSVEDGTDPQLALTILQMASGQLGPTQKWPCDSTCR